MRYNSLRIPWVFPHPSKSGTLLQVVVSEKTNEIPRAGALALPVEGRVLTVKNNQPTLFADLATYFADPHASFEQFSILDLHRGCIETRSLRVSTEMTSYLTDWPLTQQVVELTRTVTIRKTGKTRHEVVYLITALTPQKASPQRLLELVRGHWSIENSSHYVRDVTFGEDRSRLRSGQAPQILATFRNLAITLIHRQGSSQIAATRRHFASHPRLAFRLLLPRRSAQQ